MKVMVMTNIETDLDAAMGAKDTSQTLFWNQDPEESVVVDVDTLELHNGVNVLTPLASTSDDGCRSSRYRKGE